jgi:GT2 family glycosyltransferase
MHKQINLGIIIINWNSYETTYRCVSDLSGWEINRTVYIVDNGSSNNEAINLQTEFPWCEVLQANSNLGYAGANNLGIRQALKDECSHFLLLNNDASISEKSVILLIEACNQDSSVAIAGPVIMDGPGGSVLNAGGRDIARYDITHLQAIKDSSRCYSVDYVSGTAILFKADCIVQNGYLDENYFFSGEIADFCKRLAKTGKLAKTIICPQATTYHYPEMAGTNRNGIYNYYIVRNRYLYLKKHHRMRFDLYFLWMFRHLKHAWASKIKHKDGSTRWILAGLRDGLTGNYGPHSSSME